MKKKVKIGVIGSGYWGINLVRNFYELGVLKSVSDHCFTSTASSSMATCAKARDKGAGPLTTFPLVSY